jgi:hypothetical protein
MIEPLIAVGFAFYLFTKSFFDKPEELDSHKFYLDPDLDLGRQG